MKKFISFVMAAAMIATALPVGVMAAEGDVTANVKIVGGVDLSQEEAEKAMTGNGTPELQFKVTNAQYATTTPNGEVKMDVTLTLGNAKFVKTAAADFKGLVAIKDAPDVSAEATELSEDEVTITLTGKLVEDAVIAIQLESVMDKTSKGKTATVSVESDMADVDDLVYAEVIGKGIDVSIKKLVDIAVEERATLNASGLKIEAATAGSYKAEDVVTLKLNKGFEFANEDLADGTLGVTENSWDIKDGNVATFTVDADDADIVLKGIQVEAVSAKEGAIATITAKVNGSSESVEVAKVVDYNVSLTVDEDEDVPVIYSGVNVENTGITDDSDHLSLEVTIEESFPGAWSMRQGFTMSLPEGVYVTNIKNIDHENFFELNEPAEEDAWTKAFTTAYQKGDYEGFEFKKRVFDDVNTNLADDAAKLSFQLELVADPTFEGDVTLTLEGALVDTQEVDIATFVKPYVVVAQQNDLAIDYRYTEVPTNITITEAADGLWAKDTKFFFNIEKDLLEFEEDPTIEADEESGMEINGKKVDENGIISFNVKSESDEVATVTISDMQLFMERNIPAGPYALEMTSTLVDDYLENELFAKGKDDNNTIDDVTDYSKTVKEAFINVITSGRDQDDASFTTKVIVPVGENYIMSGENKVEIDVPAYITAAGYTMLPVRAVAKALGINNNSVMWSAEARTATILYGQRIITMTVGEKVVHVNGSALPASAAVEITGDRAFLPMRDLATALGVTDITWDAATKTATLNGNQK